MKEHCWSGWPGAFCLDCGTEDPMEIAIANDYFDPYTGKWGDSEEAQKLREIYELDKTIGCPLKPPLLVRYAPGGGAEMSETITPELAEIKARAEAFKRAIPEPRENFSSWQEGVFKFCVECPDDTEAVVIAADFYDRACEDIPALISEVERINKNIAELHESAARNKMIYDAQLETEILRRDSLDETLNSVVADHKRDKAKLARIRKAAESVIEEARLYDGWDTLKKDDIFKALRALADTINKTE